MLPIWGRLQSVMFSASDSLAFIQSYSPENAIINTGESVQADVTLKVPRSVALRISTRVTMTVKVIGGSSTGNFLQRWITVISRQQDTSSPRCTVSENTLQTQCSREIFADHSLCARRFWSAMFDVSDKDSGLGNIFYSYYGGSVGLEFTYY